MRKAFTLMEINLAILVMAGGILSICGLFSLGYRESRQSTEDVEAAAYADAVISPIVMAVSAPTLKWSNLQNLSSKPSDQGWRDYLDTEGKVKSGSDSEGGVFVGSRCAGRIGCKFNLAGKRQGRIEGRGACRYP